MPIGVKKPEDLADAFATVIRELVEALLVLPVPVVFGNRSKIVDFTLQQRLPTLSPVSNYVREGFLMSYGFDNHGTWARAGSYVDRILRVLIPPRFRWNKWTDFSSTSIRRPHGASALPCRMR